MKILRTNEFSEKLKIRPVDVKELSSSVDKIQNQIDNSKYFDRDVYSVVTEYEKKHLKLEYYFYKEDTIECVEYTFCYVDIPTNLDDVLSAENDCKQYQCTVDEYHYEKHCHDILDKLIHLPIENVTLSTPDGTYIDME